MLIALAASHVLLLSSAVVATNGFAQAPDAGAPGQSGIQETKVTAPPVDTLIQLAFARSPSVAALRARLDAAQQMARTPGLPNPVVEVMTQDAGFPKWTVGDMEMSMVQVGVTQSFPPLGRIGAQRAAGRAEADVRGAELEAIQRQVASQVRAFYGRLYALDRERDALDAGSALLQSLARAAMDRYSASRTEQEAVLKAQLSSSRLNERRNDLEAERSATVAGLNQLLDRQGDEPLGRVESLPEVQAPDSGWTALAISGSADVQARRAAVDAAARRVQVARSGYWPEIMAGGNIGLRGKLDPVVGFRVGVTLPLWETSRTRFEVRAAEAELQMAREEQRETEAMIRSTAARLSADWRRSAEQIRLYREALIPQSQAALNAAQSSFLTDRVDFSTVIEDFQMWLDARAQLASREAERFTTWAELQSLISHASEFSQEGR
jgi:outer membrane protein TolC